MSATPFLDDSLLRKYNTNGPRYTSYPTALEFSDTFTHNALVDAIQNSKHESLSLYIHIPFCHSLCYYCGCNKIVTRHHDKADIYLAYLAQEIIHRAALFPHKKVTQLHLGGGTPSFLTHQQLSRLVATLRENFSFAEQLEMSIEIDPREIELNLAEHLLSLGFNRLSIGVQDIDAKVQEAINRPQSTQFVHDFISHAKNIGFSSINIDLIYGLPFQTSETFAATLDKAHEMDVDRISLFSYAHLPDRFAAQRKIKDDWLPSVEDKFSLMRQAIETLCNMGYEFIGMDHFAKPSDELAIAQNQGTLHRNFQGYTTQGDADLLGLGVSSISHIGNALAQNNKDLKTYYKAIDEQNHALEHGVKLSYDDTIRAAVIRELMCHYQVNKSKISKQFDIDFDQYFAKELISLQGFYDDGLVSNTNNSIIVAPKARLLLRNICMTFDIYMQKHINKSRFSRVI